MFSNEPNDLPEKPLRLGIIGCGHWGTNYIRNFHHLSGAALTACCDIDEERLETIQKDYSYVDVCTDPARLISNKAIDAVVVSTTAATHFNLVRDALNMGKHVLAEKPLSLEPSEALELCHLAKAKKVTLLVGHTFLYNPAVIKLRQLVKDSILGTIYYMSARRTHLGLVRDDVSAIWDLCPHDVAIFNYVLQDLPVQVSAVGSSFLSRRSEDFAFISLTYPKGIIGHIFVSWVDSNKMREVVLVGSNSRVVFDDLNHLERLKIYHKGISIDKPYSNFGEFQLLLRDGDIVSPKIDMDEPLKLLCNEFLRCVTEQTQPFSDGICGWEVVSIVKSIEQSIKKNGVPIDISWTDHPHHTSTGAGR